MSTSTPTLMPTFSITSAGSPSKYLMRTVNVSVTKSLNRLTRARVEFFDGSPAGEDFAIADSSEFIPGTAIEIKAGYDGQNTTIFEGIVLAMSLEADELGAPRMVVECVDKAIKMTIGRNTAYYEKQKDSAIISTLVSNSGLSADVDATDYEWPQLVQSASTDWDFMLTRAEANGLVVVNDQNKVSVKKPGSTDSGVTATYGIDIFRLQTRMDAGTQLQAIQGNAWDPATQALVTSSSSEPTVPKQGDQTGTTLGQVAAPSQVNLNATSPIPSGPLKTWADGLLLRSRLAMIIGNVTIRGNSSVEPNTTLTLKGCGKRFNGTAYISGVHHEISKGNWTTEIETGLPNVEAAYLPGVTEAPGNGLLPGLQGVYNATVLKIDSDPDSETRIQVNIPAIGKAGSGVWARFVSPYASDGVGVFFMPEVGDEVALAFLNEDPTFPVILGSMYSSKKAPPYTPDSDNIYKAIVSKEKLKVEINDKDKVMTIETPAGFKITLDEKNKALTVTTEGSRQVLLDDQNKKVEISDPQGGTITMSSSGIAIKSDQNIDITSSQQVTVSGDSGVTVKSAATLQLQGSSMVEIS